MPTTAAHGIASPVPALWHQLLEGYNNADGRGSFAAAERPHNDRIPAQVEAFSEISVGVRNDFEALDAWRDVLCGNASLEIFSILRGAGAARLTDIGDSFGVRIQIIVLVALTTTICVF